MPANPDFRDLFAELSAANAEFLVVGAHAVMFYTVPRYTKDLDVWVRPTRSNARRVHRALEAFGAPLGELSIEDLATSGTIFQMGIAPNRIDILTGIEGVEFADAWDRRVASSYGEVAIHLLSREDLLVNKRIVGRTQDLLDVENLERVSPGDD